MKNVKTNIKQYFERARSCEVKIDMALKLNRSIYENFLNIAKEAAKNNKVPFIAVDNEKWEIVNIYLRYDEVTIRRDDKTIVFKFNPEYSHSINVHISISEWTLHHDPNSNISMTFISSFCEKFGCDVNTEIPFTIFCVFKGKREK